MSSTGVFFSTKQRLTAGCQAVLSIEWPARLDGRLPLTLLVIGKIVRSDAQTAAVEVQRCEFKIRGAQDLASPRRLM